MYLATLLCSAAVRRGVDFVCTKDIVKFLKIFFKHLIVLRCFFLFTGSWSGGEVLLPFRQKAWILENLN